MPAAAAAAAMRNPRLAITLYDRRISRRQKAKQQTLNFERAPKRVLSAAVFIVNILSLHTHTGTQTLNFPNHHKSAE